MLTSVRFRGETEDTDAEAKGFEILMPEGDASGWIQGLNLAQRREDALPGGFDKALLAGPDAGEEKIRVLGRANESLLFRTEAAAQKGLAHPSSFLQVQADGVVRESAGGEGAAVGKAEMEIGVIQTGLSVRLCRNGERRKQIGRDSAKGMDQKQLGADALAAALHRGAGCKLFQPIGGQWQAIGPVRNGIDIGIENKKHVLPPPLPVMIHRIGKFGKRHKKETPPV